MRLNLKLIFNSCGVGMGYKYLMFQESMVGFRKNVVPLLTRNESAMYFRKKTSGGRAYLQIVESRREGAQARPSYGQGQAVARSLVYLWF